MGSMMAGGIRAIGGMTGATRVRHTGPGGMSLGIGMQHLFSINHQFMDMAVINQRVRLGSTEVWEVSNDAEMAHPFHPRFWIATAACRPSTSAAGRTWSSCAAMKRCASPPASTSLRAGHIPSCTTATSSSTRTTA